MVYMADGDGKPMYCLMSARSTNARSIAPVMFEVVKMMTLLFLGYTHCTLIYLHAVLFYDQQEKRCDSIIYI